MSNETTLIRSHFPRGSSLTIPFIENVTNFGESRYDERTGMFTHSDRLPDIPTAATFRFRWRTNQDDEPILVCTTRYLGYFKLGEQVGDPHDIRIILDGTVRLVKAFDQTGGEWRRLIFGGEYVPEHGALNMLHMGTTVESDWHKLYNYFRYRGQRWPGIAHEMLSDGPSTAIEPTSVGRNRILELIQFMEEHQDD